MCILRCMNNLLPPGAKDYSGDKRRGLESLVQKAGENVSLGKKGIRKGWAFGKPSSHA